jgi:hypothetical protein
MIFDKDLQKRLTWKEEKWYNNQVWREVF